MGTDTVIHKAAALDMLILEKEVKRDLQVILQLLVEKGIATIDEINEKRSVVESKSPTIVKLTKNIEALQRDVDDTYVFFEMFEKVKKGTASDEERKMVAKIVEDNPTKYGSIIRDLVK